MAGRQCELELLAARGVPSRPYFTPLHLQPFYRTELGHGPGDFPVTERVARTTLALPWSAELSDDQVRFVADALIAAVDRTVRS
jgi:dTDP-4-amino-4,6-dideoxygalactose transaminase